MDNTTFLVISICFFVIAAGFITWGSIEGPKRSKTCKIMALCYVIVTWLCILALIALTAIRYFQSIQ